jgi:hypothetical protein
MVFRYLSLVFTLIFFLSSAVYAAPGAGVLLFFDDGTTLLGREMRPQGRVWSDLGGKQDPRETLAQTATREGNEESAGSFKNQLTLARVQQAEANGDFADHIHPATGNSYREYFVWLHGPKPSIQAIHKNAALLKKRLGHKAHVEKDDWRYFPAQLIMNGHNLNGNLPGTNEPLYGPTKAILRKPTTQAFFSRFINAAKNAPVPAARGKRVIAPRGKRVAVHRGHRAAVHRGKRVAVHRSHRVVVHRGKRVAVHRGHGAKRISAARARRRR